MSGVSLQGHRKKFFACFLCFWLKTSVYQKSDMKKIIISKYNQLTINRKKGPSISLLALLKL